MCCRRFLRFSRFDFSEFKLWQNAGTGRQKTSSGSSSACRYANELEGLRAFMHTHTHTEVTGRQTIKHFRSILLSGVAVLVVDQICQTVTVWTFLAHRTHRLPLVPHLLEAVSPINSFLYDIIGVPVMWIKPQTMFDNQLWTVIIIGVFWGVVLHFVRVFLGLFVRFIATRLYRYRRSDCLCHERDI